MTRHGSVYALCTPQGTPFYVGATVQSVGTRVGQHLRDARRGRKSSSVHQLLAATERTGFWILERGVELADLGARERYWKLRLERAGNQLANYHHGANGCNFQPNWVKIKLSAFATKRPRNSQGQFLPTMPAIAGGDFTPAERFARGEEL